MIELHERVSLKTVCINPDRVTRVKEGRRASNAHGPGKSLGTSIRFGPADELMVAESLTEVVKMIEGAK